MFVTNLRWYTVHPKQVPQTLLLLGLKHVMHIIVRHR